MTPTDHVSDGMSWREAGEGPVVLFLHGLGGSRIAWEAQLAGLSDRYRCVAWEMPGYGDSAPLRALTFPAVTSAIVRLLDILGVERAHVVGLSFGGQQALHFALDAPDRLCRLVLADTSAAFGADGTDVAAWKRLRLDPLDAGVTPTAMASSVVDAITAPGFSGIERDRAVAAFSRISSDGLRASVECLPTHDVADRLGEISAPTLVVVGELDEETPIAYSRRLAVGIPRAELRVIERAGHLTPSEAPQVFNELVATFLAEPAS